MTEQEIEKKLEQFKSGLELFKTKLDDARDTIGARDAQIEDIEKDIEVLQKMNNEKSEKIKELESQLCQKDSSEKEMSEQQRRDINTLNEYAGQILDLQNDVKSLEEKLASEKEKNKKLTEESLTNKTDIDKERTKLSKKLEDTKKSLKDTNTLLEAKTAEYESLKKEYESLQVAYTSEKEKVKTLKEKAAHTIVTMPASEASVNKAIIHYNLGPTSETVMNKFIEVIKAAFQNAIKKDQNYYITSIEEAARNLKLSNSDTEVIKTRLLSMKSPSNKPLLQEDEAGKLYTELSMDEFISWISKIKDK